MVCIPAHKMKMKQAHIVPPDDDLIYEFFIKTSETLEEAGYVHYEVSNFARGENECRSTTASTGITPPISVSAQRGGSIWKSSGRDTDTICCRKGMNYLT